MAEITDIKKTPAVAEKIHGATVNFTAEELLYLATALEGYYKAHRAGPDYYVSPTAKSLYKTVQAARNGQYKPAPSMQDTKDALLRSALGYNPLPAPRFA